MRRGYTVSNTSDFDLICREKNVVWAWIAYGILHKDSCLALSRLNLTKVDAPHPGRELLQVTSLDLNDVIDREEEPLPDGKRVFVTLRA